MPETAAKIRLPANHLLGPLVGEHDINLRRLQAAFPHSMIHLRGNELSVSGDEADTVARLFEELIVLIERGQRLDDRTLESVAALAQPRMRTLGDFGFLTPFFFADAVPLDAAALAGDREPREVAESLLLVEWALEDLRDFGEEPVREAIRTVADSIGVKLRRFTRPLYLAVTGSASSTPLFASMVVLGSAMTRMRLRRARAVLGGVPRRREKERAARRSGKV